jgi:hypothetical protein
MYVQWFYERVYLVDLRFSVQRDRSIFMAQYDKSVGHVSAVGFYLQRTVYECEITWWEAKIRLYEDN